MCIRDSLATSVSGSTTHWLKNTLDYKMGLMIVIGGTIGTVVGIFTFTYFKDIRNMGYKPFVVGFTAMLTVGVVSIITIETYIKFFI